MTRKKFLFLTVMFFICSIFIYSFSGSKGDLVENLNIPVAVGCDLKESSMDDLSYKITISTYVIDDSENVFSESFTGIEKSIGETRSNRQIKSSKKFLFGVERIFLLSETYSKYGIRTLLDIVLNTPHASEKVNMVVCDGTAEDILKLKIKGYATPGEFIDGLIKNSSQYNFFSNSYTIMDAFKKVDAEGFNITLPYIEVKDQNVELTGLAIFNKDKMVAKTNLDEAKVINLLRENGVKCMMTIQKSPEKYINYYAKSQRKVHCYKTGDKYRFIIDLNLSGAISSNTLYKDLNSDLKVLQEFTSDMENQILSTCNNYILTAKSKYDVDIFNLGSVGAARYGRQTGIDWNKVFSDADIEIRVKVKVDNQGRGSY